MTFEQQGESLQAWDSCTATIRATSLISSDIPDKQNIAPAVTGVGVGGGSPHICGGKSNTCTELLSGREQTRIITDIQSHINEIKSRQKSSCCL